MSSVFPVCVAVYPHCFVFFHLDCSVGRASTETVLLSRAERVLANAFVDQQLLLMVLFSPLALLLHGRGTARKPSARRPSSRCSRRTQLVHNIGSGDVCGKPEKARTTVFRNKA